MRQPRLRTIMITAGTTIALIGTGSAYAAVAGPIDSSGVIHGCYYPATTGGSHKVVLQDTGTACPSGTTAIKWNQKGPAGPTGAAGPQGPQGATGPQGPQGPSGVSQLYTYFRDYSSGSPPEVAPNGTGSFLGSLTLPAGAYMAEATVAFQNNAAFPRQDNSRLILCDLDPTPEYVRIVVNGADAGAGAQNYATLTMTAAIGFTNHSFTASLLCGAVSGGTDQSWVFVNQVRINALAVDNIQSQ